MVAVCGSSASAASLNWAGVVDSYWGTTGNWADPLGSTTYVAPPQAGDTVYITTAWSANPNVIVNSPANGGSALNIGYVGEATSVDIQSSLTATNIYAGVFGTGTATINLNSVSGSITSTADTFIGYYQSNGILNMSAGTITADHFYVGFTAGAHGTATVTGGTITTNWLGMDAAGGVGTLTMGGTGKVVINATKYSTTANWINTFNVWSGTQILNAQANIVGDTVEITAIPEPATFVLLSLGGIAALRRRLV
jgi:hypothetical protein